MAGRSAQLDPHRYAVRSDLADIRLADRIFAPHYASPLPMIVQAGQALRADRSADAEVLALLVPGDVFEVLDMAGGVAWGVAPGYALVGYIPDKILARKAS